jgi:hypothetical protein
VVLEINSSRTGFRNLGSSEKSFTPLAYKNSSLDLY